MGDDEEIALLALLLILIRRRRRVGNHNNKEKNYPINNQNITTKKRKMGKNSRSPQHKKSFMLANQDTDPLMDALYIKSEPIDDDESTAYGGNGTQDIVIKNEPIDDWSGG